MFSVQTKSRKPAFSHSSGVKSVFEKHPFHDGLLWTEGLTVEKQLRFQIFPVKCGRCLISHPMITRCRKCLVLSFIFSLVFTFINCSVSVHDIYSLLLLNKREINRKQRAMNSESARKKHRIRLVTSYFFHKYMIILLLYKHETIFLSTFMQTWECVWPGRLEDSTDSATTKDVSLGSQN